MKPDIAGTLEITPEQDPWYLAEMEAFTKLGANLIDSGHWGIVSSPPISRRRLVTAEWYIECQSHGWAMLNHLIEIDPGRRGGVPVLRGTGFTVAQLFAELAETEAVEEVADNFSLDIEQIRDLLNGFSLIMQRSQDK